MAFSTALFHSLLCLSPLGAYFTFRERFLPSIQTEGENSVAGRKKRVPSTGTPLAMYHKNNKLHEQNVHVVNLVQIHTRSTIVTLVSMNSYEPCLFDSMACVLIVSLISFINFHFEIFL